MAKKRINLPYDRASDGPCVPVFVAARRIGCSDSWVYKLVAAGELQAYRIGSRKGVQITVRSIDAYIDRKAVKPDKA